MNPSVSILIPCYNAARWVKQAIESALAQTWPEKEIIVIDDGSTDASLQIIQSFAGRIRWESGPNRGGGAARNRLLELARGEWLQYLDADDYLLPDKIAAQIAFLKNNTVTDVIFGPVTLEHWTESNSRKEFLAIPQPHDLWVLLARWYLPQTGSPLWRKQAVIDVGGWKPTQTACQEHELYLRLLIAGKRMDYCSSNGAVYRQWGDHTVCTRDKPEVHRRRLEIEQGAEDFLRASGGLTAERRHAINLARFEIARSEWQFNEDRALEIMEIVYRSEPEFRPRRTPAAPLRYRVALALVGFGRAERLAKWLRDHFGTSSYNSQGGSFV